MRTKRNVSTLLNGELALGSRIEDIFTDIRTAPEIPLSHILLDVALMPLLEIKSLLKLDFFSRFKWFKDLFGRNTGERRLVCSDSTVQRVMRWIAPGESAEFLRSFIPEVQSRGADTYQLSPEGRRRRIIVGDGSVMGSHHLVAFTLVGDHMNYPFFIEGTAGRGNELPRAVQMVKAIPDLFPEDRSPDLLLYDYLGFNRSLFSATREARMHILVKGGESSFREVVNDARALFDAGREESYERSSGFDPYRLCRWTIEETSDTFAGYSVRVARLIEEPCKGQGKAETSWIVTTDFSLSAEELQEAAHVRWSIENNVFKKLSGLVKTKRFHFKERRPFLSLLRILCGALAAYDLTLFMMRDKESGIKGFLGPLKWTYGIVYVLFFFSLEESCFG